MAYCEIKSINAPERTHGDHLVIKNISVVDSWSYPDCSYKERIKLQFTPCNKDGSINGTDWHSIVEIGAFSIVKLDELIKAFKYRGYYCKI